MVNTSAAWLFIEVCPVKKNSRSIFLKKCNSFGEHTFSKFITVPDDNIKSSLKIRLRGARISRSNSEIQ
jgi:hypothetical protein